MNFASKKPGDKTTEASESLSATGMFLNAFSLGTAEGNEGDRSFPPPAVKPPAGGERFSSSPSTSSSATSPAAATASPDETSALAAASDQTTPGEFTQLFQSMAPSRPVAPRPSGAAYVPAAPLSPLPASAPAPGEFTQVFVGGQLPVQPAARTMTDTEAAAAVPPRKGFSTPGASDSASSAGQFTQLFAGGLPVAQAPPAAMEALSPNQSDSRFDLGTNGQRPGTPQNSGLTDIFRSIEDSRSEVEQSQVRDDRAFGALKPMAAPVTHSQPANSVTQMIDLLSAFEPQPLPVPVPSAQPVAVTAPRPAAAPAADGPGELTQILTGIPARGLPLATPAHPVAQPISPAAVAQAPMAGALPQIPRPLPEPPKAAPVNTPPVIPAPRNKLQEMVPILLVVNTFLLVVLLVAVIFALKAR